MAPWTSSGSSKSFATWEELQNNPEFLANVKKCNDSLKASEDFASKGAGKGAMKGPTVAGPF